MTTNQRMVDSAADRIMLLRREQRRRWNSGDCVAIEVLLEDSPDLAHNDRAILDLVFTELRLRSRFGDSPVVGDYRQRFPALEHHIERLLEDHQTIQSLEQSRNPAAGDRPPLRSLPPDAAELLEQFAQAWHAAAQPRIDEFHGRDRLNARARARLLEELVLIDMEYRWIAAHQDAANQPGGGMAAPQGGDLPPRPLSEDYLRELPELGSLESPPLELIVAEFRIRRRWERPNPAEYATRFPSHGERLRELLARLENDLAPIPAGGTRGPGETQALNLSTPSGHAAGAGKLTQALPAGGLMSAGGFDPDAPLPYGDFELEAEIGAGGMGTVYRAVQKSLNKPVALKVLRSVQTGHPVAVQRFLREARTVAQFRHPNIVDIHGIGRTPDHGYFMVMDLVDGQDLEALISAQAVSHKDVGIVLTIAEAIEHAHRGGVVHRDLKPSNVLVDTNGRVLVTDFGLAKLLDTQESRLSLPGQTLGTPSYMAPEQASRRWGEVGPRTDVYGLGGILYAVLTGQPPYDGQSFTEVLLQVASEDPPIAPRRIRADVPEAFEEICLKCLRKDPVQRFQSAEEVARQLRRCMAAGGGGEPLHVAPPLDSGSLGHRVASAAAPFGTAASSDASRNSGPPMGAMPPDSPFYLVRSADHQFEVAVSRHDSIVLVRGARQMGKTSLLARGLTRPRELGTAVVLTDLQKLHADELQTPEGLFRTLGEWMADDLDLDVYPADTWDARRSASINFERYLRREILQKAPGPIVWVLDEVDRLFDCPFRSEVFGLFRSWHNARALQPAGPWSKLTLAMAYATEAHLFISDPNQSPFNVGTLITMEDFNREQIAALNGRYASPLRDESQMARFERIVGGHPYLVNRGLYEMAVRPMTIDAFEETSHQDDGIFGDHLRRLLVMLRQDHDLADVFRQLLGGRPCPTVESFYGLRSAGFISGDSTHNALARCQLYASYFGRHLQ